MENINVQSYEGEYDDEGVYVYQAYCDSIANYAIENQKLGGPLFNTKRMTWIKPSFAWVLYRSGYATKHNQERILKIKLSHKAIAEILEKCSCKHGGGGSFGRVQWDPARDLYTVEDGEPRKMLNRRAIQIGTKGPISEFYVSSILSIQDVTSLAHKVGIAHGVLIANEGVIKKNNKKNAVHFNDELLKELPEEKIYMPDCKKSVLENLGMEPGKTADAIAKIGKGKTIV